MSVIQWLESSSKAWEGMGHSCLEKWVLENGSMMKARIDLPSDVHYGRVKECFANAFQIAAYMQDKYTYCEGFAYSPGLIAVHHAWVVDADGNVIDNTWRDGGYECGFCEDGMIEEEVFDDEDDSEWGSYEERECHWCLGTGKTSHEHPSREGCEYYGITVERKKLVKLVLAKGIYGVLPDCIEELV